MAAPINIPSIKRVVFGAFVCTINAVTTAFDGARGAALGGVLGLLGGCDGLTAAFRGFETLDFFLTGC